MLIIGLDLGQVNDFTAVAVLEASGDRPRRDYACRHLERWRGVAYPEQVERVGRLRTSAALAEAPLVVDYTGCGRPVVDMLRVAGLRPLAVTIHGGDTVSHTPDQTEWRIPKRDLVAVVAVQLQARRLKIAQALPDAATLTAELTNFRVKIDPATAHDSYSAWRDNQHDDLILATALAAWWGENGPEPRPITCLVGGARYVLTQADQMRRQALGLDERQLNLAAERAMGVDLVGRGRLSPRDE